MAGFFCLGMRVGRATMMSPPQQEPEDIQSHPQWNPRNVMEPISNMDQQTTVQKARDLFARFKEEN